MFVVFAGNRKNTDDVPCTLTHGAIKFAGGRLLSSIRSKIVKLFINDTGGRNYRHWVGSFFDSSINDQWTNRFDESLRELRRNGTVPLTVCGSASSFPRDNAHDHFSLSPRGNGT